MGKTRIEVHFTHPRNSNSFTAFVSPECTAQMAIEGLIKGDDTGSFLESPPPGRPYELAIKRSGQAINLEMTFEQAGVIDGDTIEVRQAGQGAGESWTISSQKAEAILHCYGGSARGIMMPLFPLLQFTVALKCI